MKIWIRLHRIFHHKAIVLLSESERLMLIKSLLTAAAPEGLQKHEIFNFKHNTLRPSTILLYSHHGHWTNLLFFLSIRLIWTLWFWSQKDCFEIKYILAITDYGRPVRKLHSLHGRKSNPNPNFLGMAEAYFVCHIGPNFQISLIYALTWCP